MNTASACAPTVLDQKKAATGMAFQKLYSPSNDMIICHGVTVRNATDPRKSTPEGEQAREITPMIPENQIMVRLMAAETALAVSW